MRYFKRRIAEPVIPGSPAYAWFEFDGDLPARQVERYGDRWFNSRADYHDELGPKLTDRTPAELGLDAADATTSTEFEEAWLTSAKSG